VLAIRAALVGHMEGGPQIKAVCALYLPRPARWALGALARFTGREYFSFTQMFGRR